MEFTIQREGNLVAITPAAEAEALLAAALSYWHASYDLVMRKGKRPVRKMQNRRKLLYSVEPETDQLLAPYGMYDRAIRKIKSKKHTHTFVDHSNIDRPQPNFTAMYSAFPGLKFKEGQQEILALMAIHDIGRFKCATAFGKSFTIRLACAAFPQARFLIVMPGIPNIKGMFKELIAATPNVGMYGGGKKQDEKRVVVACKASLGNIDVNSFDFLLYDEVHSAGAPKVQVELARAWKPKMFGFSANMEGRCDKADKVVEALFGPVLYEVNYKEAEANNLVSAMVVLRLKLDSCPGADIFTTNSVARKRAMYWRNERRNKLMADFINLGLQEHCEVKDPQILVLVDVIDHAAHLSRMLPDFTVVHGDGGNKEDERLTEMTTYISEVNGQVMTAKARDKYQEDFASGKLRRVIATGCWGTGVDFPGLNVLVLASGPASEIITTQWPGRAARLADGKTVGLVVDPSDEWNDWPYSRAQKREAVYKSSGWPIKEIGGTRWGGVK